MKKMIIIFLFSITCMYAQDVYIVKIEWHTGILINIKDLIKTQLSFKDEIQDFNYIDIGWGDSAFYQTPGLDYQLAFQALFFSPSSTIRLEAYENNIEKILSYYDTHIKITLEPDAFDKLIEYIEKSLYKDENNSNILQSASTSGKVRFYKSNKKYSLFNTCNTWIAQMLYNSGVKINRHILFAEQLFEELEYYKQ